MVCESNCRGIPNLDLGSAAVPWLSAIFRFRLSPLRKGHCRWGDSPVPAHREKSEFAIKASRREIMRDLTHKRGGYTHREAKATASSEKAKGISQPRYHRGIIFPSPCHLPSSDIASRFSEVQREIGTEKHCVREREKRRERGRRRRSEEKREVFISLYGTKLSTALARYYLQTIMVNPSGSKNWVNLRISC